MYKAEREFSSCILEYPYREKLAGFSSFAAMERGEAACQKEAGPLEIVGKSTAPGIKWVYTTTRTRTRTTTTTTTTEFRECNQARDREKQREREEEGKGREREKGIATPPVQSLRRRFEFPPKGKRANTPNERVVPWEGSSVERR